MATQFSQVRVDDMRKSEISELLPMSNEQQPTVVEWKIAHSCIVCSKTLDKDERRVVHTESGENYIEILLLSVILLTLTGRLQGIPDFTHFIIICMFEMLPKYFLQSETR